MLPRLGNEIVTTGVGRRVVQTTLASVVLSITARNSKAEVAQAKVAKASGELLNYLGASGVTKMQTQGITLEPQTGHRDATMYECSETVWVEVPAERCGALLDGAIAAGATRVSSVSFKATDKATEELRLAAIEDAVLCAQNEAQAVARALNCTVGTANHVDVQRVYAGDESDIGMSDFTRPALIRVPRSRHNGIDAGDIPSPKQKTVTATVTVRFSVN